MQNQWNSSCRILCISQTHCQKLSEISHCQNSQCVGNPAKIRNANFAMPISQCKFRNANFANFAMRISKCQFRNANFAMPISISQCQCTVHLSHNQILSEISHCEIRRPLCEIRKPISHCQLHQLCEIHPAKFTGLVILCN